MRYLPLLLLLLPGLAMAQSSAISGRIEPGPTGVLAGYPANGIVIGPVTNVNLNGKLNAVTFGAKGDAIYSSDGVRAADGACSGTTFTSATGNFTPALVGKSVLIDIAGPGSFTYVGTVSGFTSATSLVVSPACTAAVSNQSYRIGTDNTGAFQAAINAVPNQARGTVYIPAGNYLTLSQVTVGPTKCNITIEGDPSGTILMPYFFGASQSNTANAYAFADFAPETPQQCYGGMRNITFLNIGNAPQYLNLVRVEDEQGLTFSEMRANIYAGPGDSFFYLDPGAGGDLNHCAVAPNPTDGSKCSWTEQTLMRNINNWFTTNMVTFAGMGPSVTSFSLNNNTIELGQCNPADGGACIFDYQWGAAGALLSSKLDFNADINTTNGSLIRDDHRADDWNATWTVNIRTQSLATNTAIFDAPAGTGYWYVTGSVADVSGNGTVQERNGNPVFFNPNWRGHGSNIYNGPVSLSSCGTGPTITTGSTANAGEIIAGTGATSCTLNFTPSSLGPNNITCNITADGQPTFLYTEGSKGTNTVTVQCRVITTGTNCMAGAFFSYACTGF